MSRAAYHGGLAAEEIAERLFLAKGATVLARRARMKPGEIDLIVELDGEIVFVEVKARRTHAAAAASLSPRQQTRILAAAEAWFAATERPLATACRFDVVTVAGDGSVEHIPNALSG